MSNLTYELPNSVDEISNDGKVAKFSIKPLERGYGITLGNSLRRVLLSSIPGAAIINVEIDGVEHQFSTIDGVYEDVMTIILNLKEIIFKVETDDLNFRQKIELDVFDQEEIKAGDFRLVNGVEIINKDLVICHLNKETHFRMIAEVGLGSGYVSSEENKKTTGHIGQIATDSIFGPVNRVAYHVEKIRGDKDELQIEIETNGAISAEDALAIASDILIQHFEVIKKISKEAGFIDVFQEAEDIKDEKHLNMKIDDLDLTVRTYNALRRGGIYTVDQLLGWKEEDVRKFRGLGKKSCNELKEKLEQLGLSFQTSGMDDDFDDDDDLIEDDLSLDEDDQ